jgi:hypothetical protein
MFTPINYSQQLGVIKLMKPEAELYCQLQATANSKAEKTKTKNLNSFSAIHWKSMIDYWDNTVVRKWILGFDLLF